jgi:putative membrane protein
MTAPPFPRWLARTDRVLWILFLVWTAAGSITMPLGLGDAHLGLVEYPAAIEALLAWALRAGDAIWITLGAAVVYLSVARREGFATARIWAVILLAGSGLIEWIGATTGWPFGPYRYSDQFGMRLGNVLPFTIPLAWLVIILAARALILRIAPNASRPALAAGVGAVALLTDLNLEFVAWKSRGYWVWYPDWTPALGPMPSWPPLQNFVSWFLVAAALCAMLPAPGRVDTGKPQPIRPVIVLALMNALFLAVHLARHLRS